MAAVIRVEGTKFTGRHIERVADFLTVEAPLQIRLNGQSLTVTMRTPGNDLELTRGLLFTEDIAPEGTDPILQLKRDDSGEVTTVCCTLEGATIDKSARSQISSSSCGLCGKIELTDLSLSDIRLTASAKLDLGLISGMFRQMQERQENFRQSGGCHSAASFDIQGRLINSFEDIGRHNAVDKVIGDLLLKNNLRDAECLLVSGRVSYEIVSKAAKAGLSYLIAVSAPSSLAISIAEKTGMTILGFCRDGRATVYSNPSRVVNNLSEKP